MSTVGQREGGDELVMKDDNRQRGASTGILPDDDNDSWRGAHHMQMEAVCFLQCRVFLADTYLALKLVDIYVFSRR
jgi:hypothetical protein